MGEPKAKIFACGLAASLAAGTPVRAEDAAPAHEPRKRFPKASKGCYLFNVSANLRGNKCH